MPARVAMDCGIPHSPRQSTGLIGCGPGGSPMLRLVIALALAPLAFGAVQAQTAYPNRPVKIIVPIAPGGSYDLVGRAVTDALSPRSRQTVFVENKTGA